VLLFGFKDGDFGGAGAVACESIKPNKTMNGNAKMKSMMSRLRVFNVMLASGLAKNQAASIIQMLTPHGDFN
jgi:hypothetical protein